MLKKIFNILKKLVLACFLLYGYNLIAAPLGIVIPLNFITILLVTIFGVPALCSFIVVFLIMF